MTLLRRTITIGHNPDGSPVYKTNEDGTLHYEYIYEGDPEGGALLTGPLAKGRVVLASGKVYDVTDPVIEVAPGDGPRVAYHIAKQHEESGKLTELVHGDDYDGPACIVLGDEDGYEIGHVGDTISSEDTPPLAE